MITNKSAYPTVKGDDDPNEKKNDSAHTDTAIVFFAEKVALAIVHNCRNYTTPKRVYEWEGISLRLDGERKGWYFIGNIT